MKPLNVRWMSGWVASLIGGLLLLSTATRVCADNPIYPDPSKARDDISAAEVKAGPLHKRVLIIFGANWCGDCKALQAYLQRPENYQLVDENYVVVHVNVGLEGIDTNFDVADQYGVPLKKGVPAIAVINADGGMVYSQRHGEFESMRSMDPSALNEFLIRYKPPKSPKPVSQD